MPILIGMVTRRELLGMFSTNFLMVVGWIAGLPSATLLIGLLFGFSLRPLETYTIVSAALPFVERYGWLALIALVVVVAFETSYRVVKENRIQAEKSLYSVNHTARRERGHYIFYQLHKEGEALLPEGSDGAWQQWDQNIRREIIDHCSDDILSLYLQDTERVAFDRREGPISPDRYRRAVESIQRHVLDSAYINVFR